MTDAGTKPCRPPSQHGTRKEPGQNRAIPNHAFDRLVEIGRRLLDYLGQFPQHILDGAGCRNICRNI
jgi:hypothetical protein